MRTTITTTTITTTTTTTPTITTNTTTMTSTNTTEYRWCARTLHTPLWRVVRVEDSVSRTHQRETLDRELWQSDRRWMIPHRLSSLAPTTTTTSMSFPLSVSLSLSLSLSLLSSSLCLSLSPSFYLSFSTIPISLSVILYILHINQSKWVRARVYIYKFQPQACCVTAIKFAYRSKTSIDGTYAEGEIKNKC